MVARIQNKILVLVLSLMEMREIKGKHSIIKRIMRNLPFNVLERHLAKVYKSVNTVYGDRYLMESFHHMEDNPLDTSEAPVKVHRKYYETIIQNGFNVFILICYYFESDEPNTSSL
jgi:hypothetical protein